MAAVLEKLGLGQNVKVDVVHRHQDGYPRRTVPVDVVGGAKEDWAVYEAGEPIACEVQISPPPGKKLDHQGIRVTLQGRIVVGNDKSDFMNIVRELTVAGSITQPTSFPVVFQSPGIEHESYRGSQVQVLYQIRVRIALRVGARIERKLPFWVKRYEPLHEPTQPLKMEVGIEDCLHLEFEYTKNRFHLNDVVVGRIHFQLVRIALKSMEIEIRRRETVGSGPTAFNDTQVMGRFSIMDGAPVRGETIPIRLFLEPYKLTPTYRAVNNRFSVAYFLNLVLVDEEDRRYFKQQEIFLYRVREDDADTAMDHVRRMSGSVHQQAEAQAGVDALPPPPAYPGNPAGSYPAGQGSYPANKLEQFGMAQSGIWPAATASFYSGGPTAAQATGWPGASATYASNGASSHEAEALPQGPDAGVGGDAAGGAKAPGPLDGGGIAKDRAPPAFANGDPLSRPAAPARQPAQVPHGGPLQAPGGYPPGMGSASVGASAGVRGPGPGVAQGVASNEPSRGDDGRGGSWPAAGGLGFGAAGTGGSHGDGGGPQAPRPGGILGGWGHRSAAPSKAGADEDSFTGVL